MRIDWYREWFLFLPPTKSTFYFEYKMVESGTELYSFGADGQLPSGVTTNASAKKVGTYMWHGPLFT